MLSSFNSLLLVNNIHTENLPLLYMYFIHIVNLSFALLFTIHNTNPMFLYMHMYIFILFKFFDSCILIYHVLTFCQCHSNYSSWTPFMLTFFSCQYVIALWYHNNERGIDIIAYLHLFSNLNNSMYLIMFLFLWNKYINILFWYFPW